MKLITYLNIITTTHGTIRLHRVFIWIGNVLTEIRNVVSVIVVLTRTRGNNSVYGHSGAVARWMIGIGKIVRKILGVAYAINHNSLYALTSSYIIARKFKGAVFW